MITVTNGKQVGFIGQNKIYIGRANQAFKLKQSILCNPFRIGVDGTRQETIEKFRRYLWQKLQEKDLSILAELNYIKSKAIASDVELVCWCSPKECHGDVISRCVQWMIREETKHD